MLVKVLPEAKTVRFVVYDGEEDVDEVGVLRDPLSQEATFPATRLRRSRLTHRIRDVFHRPPSTRSAKSWLNEMERSRL